jgi:hypothetical protein
MNIGSTVNTKTGPMTVTSTRRAAGAWVLVVLTDPAGAEWLTRVRPGKSVNRTHALVPND